MRAFRSRSRRPIALACVAIVILAAVFPLGGSTLDWFVYTPEFILLPPSQAEIGVAPVEPAAERLHALLSIVDGRGPPDSSRS